MDFVIPLDNQSTAPLHRQLSDELRRAILTGRLVPGERLPSTRAMAGLLGVSRVTVTQSYEDLISEGYLQAAHGSGTFICQQLPEELLRPAPLRSDSRAARTTGRAWRLSAYGGSIGCAESAGEATNRHLISFRYGTPSFEQFPWRQWGRLLSRHARAASRTVFDYHADESGYRPLREAIARYLARARAARCAADQVVIVSGSQQGLDLIARLLLDRGDQVAVEDPCYLGARRIFEATGARLFSVPVDESGIEVERLTARSVPQIKLVYVTPSHQFPTGALLSLPRRLALIAWAEQRGAVIVEDDYDSEYRYGGRPVPALQGLDQSGSVIYVGTFSKVMFPSLRIGYLVVPSGVARVFARARWLADRQSPMLEQCALADFINEGHLERHIRRMRTLYDRRRQALVRALASHFGGRVTVMGESAGMHLMARLQTGIGDEEVIARAARAGVEMISARPNYLRGRPAGEFIFGYSDLSERKILEAVRRLDRALGGPGPSFITASAVTGDQPPDHNPQAQADAENHAG
ncbi:MAG TPA: PLP-dependent aminotransferase family protein [Blastocatellia bacterium]|nr:PLP-dependent aminotransferase family protein [Blastocatellia bacterium]